MLPIKIILHATDFSERSDAAYRVACWLARDYGARLVVLHVIEPPMAVAGEGVLLLRQEVDQKALREKLDMLQQWHPKVRVEQQLAEGNPASEILRVAEETKPDVIVMGTHGRTGLGRLLMGSVAEQVLRRAPCPVLTVRIPFPEMRAPKEHVREMAGTVAEHAP